jgi:ribonuclease P protein component
LADLSTIKKPRFTLCGDERLSRKKLIEVLHTKGLSIKTPAIILVYHFAELPCSFPAQAMFSASKRIFKRAHDRNRAKRLLREAYRKQKHIVYSSLHERQKQVALHFIFTGRQLPNYPYVHGKISELLKRFNEELQKNTGPDAAVDQPPGQNNLTT